MYLTCGFQCIRAAWKDFKWCFISKKMLDDTVLVQLVNSNVNEFHSQWGRVLWSTPNWRHLIISGQTPQPMSWFSATASTEPTGVRRSLQAADLPWGWVCGGWSPPSSLPLPSSELFSDRNVTEKYWRKTNDFLDSVWIVSLTTHILFGDLKDGCELLML